MHYCTADAQREFERWSRRYDWDPLQPLFFHPSHRMILDCLCPHDLRILDIGCGTGQFAASLLEGNPKAQIWGLDLCDSMLRKAQGRSCCLGGRFHLVQGNSSHLPFTDDFFDAVTCSHSFHHYPDQGRVLAEMHRVLRPDGRLLLVDGDRDRLWGWLIFDVLVVMVEGPVKHRTGEDLRKLYDEAGFADVTQRRRGGPLPFLMTVGRAVKVSDSKTADQAA
jgi:ubiquinone/menaquinone biosynthesis C-methylase UbiE